MLIRILGILGFGLPGLGLSFRLSGFRRLGFVVLGFVRLQVFMCLAASNPQSRTARPPRLAVVAATEPTRAWAKFEVTQTVCVTS